MDVLELQRIRATPLESVLEGFGAQRDPKDPKHNWKHADSRITVDVANQRFFDHNKEVGGGGAVDLTMHLMGYDFKSPSREAFRAAVQWLGATERVAQAAVAQESRRADPATIEPASSKQETPVPDAARLARVRHYLTDVRAIPAQLVDAAIEQGRIFADSKGNAVFRLFDADGKEVGFEKRGTYDKPFHGVYGEKGLFAVGSRRAGVAAFVESAIEALSYKALHPEALVISTTGNAIELPQKVAQALLGRGAQVVAAFNADMDGDRFAERFNERLGGVVKRDRPDEQLGKDWNLVLRATRVGVSRERFDQLEMTR
jgi:hypothetical protein